MFRIDPIDDEGKFDAKFFAQDDYHVYRECLEKYLISEGFDVIDQKVIVQLMDRAWLVYPINNHHKTQ
jgi:hypothetical protein